MYTRQESQVRYSSISSAIKELEFYILKDGSPLECGLSLTVRVTLWPEPQVMQLLETCQSLGATEAPPGQHTLTTHPIMASPSPCPAPSDGQDFELGIRACKRLVHVSGCTCLADWYLPQASLASSLLAQPTQKEHANCTVRAGQVGVGGL